MGTIMWLIKGDTGSLDYSSYQGHRASIYKDNIMGTPGNRKLLSLPLKSEVM